MKEFIRLLAYQFFCYIFSSNCICKAVSLYQITSTYYRHNKTIEIVVNANEEELIRKPDFKSISMTPVHEKDLKKTYKV